MSSGEEIGRLSLIYIVIVVVVVFLGDVFYVVILTTAE